MAKFAVELTHLFEHGYEDAFEYQTFTYKVDSFEEAEEKAAELVSGKEHLSLAYKVAIRIAFPKRSDSVTYWTSKTWYDVQRDYEEFDSYMYEF